LWTIPAVGLPFFLLLGVGAAADGGRASPRRRLTAAAAVVVVLLAALLFAPPWLAARLSSQGEASGSRGDLRWARRLDPLALDPLLAEYQVSKSAAERIRIGRTAVRMEPRFVTTQYLLGLAYLDGGRPHAAATVLRRALRLDPREEQIRILLRRAQRR
jgi:cytochrome c-type biogenesis protein CcmH/NrfG